MRYVIGIIINFYYCYKDNSLKFVYIFTCEFAEARVI